MDTEPFRLVLAFDASPAALQAARFVAAHEGAATQVLALIVPPREALAAQAGRELDAARAALQGAPLEAEYAVRAGFPPEVIVAEARDRAAHAIVAGTRGRGGVMGLGSVASEILRGSEFPLVLVKHDARIPGALGRSARVVVAADGSVESLRAAALVPAWLEWLGEVEAHVVHAQEPIPLLDKLVPPHHDPLRRESGREGDEIVRACAGALAGCRAVHTHVVPGDPATCITRLAAESQADLVVMGTRGRGARSHALFGSVAMKTVQWSAVPVVLVP
jgi:nucleotide-binding universal stress UspA family protein